MAAKSKPAKGKQARKNARGKLPVKRTINLVLVNENKISPLKAIPAILLIIALAAVFSKFMVYDRLVEKDRAEARVITLRDTLDQARATLESFDNVEDDYAHYTVAGMSAAELSLVDRTQVQDLVGSVLPVSDTTLNLKSFSRRTVNAYKKLRLPEEKPKTLSDLIALLTEAHEKLLPEAVTTRSWSISGNLMTVELATTSLEKLNQLARQMELSPIVDSCTITTANKKGRTESGEDVNARFIVYLRQAPEEEGEAQ